MALSRFDHRTEPDSNLIVLDADYATLLSNLLHYPSPSALYPFSPFLILTQAAFLRDNTNPSAGVEVVMQNHQILAIKASVLELDGHVPSRPSPGFRQPVQRVQSPRSMQGLAAGLFERAQAAGKSRWWPFDASADASYQA